MYKIKRFSCMIEFMQKEFGRKSKQKFISKQKAIKEQTRAQKLADEAATMSRNTEIDNLAEIEQKVAKSQQAQEKANNAAKRYKNAVEKSKKNGKTVKVKDDKIVSKGENFKLTVRNDGQVRAANLNDGFTASTSNVENQLNTAKRNVAYRKHEMSKDFLHSKPAPVVGQAPKVEQKVAQVAEEVVAHKPAAPTMEQIAKEGANDVKKVTKGLGKWGKRGLIAAGTVAVGSGLAYGGKKLYDKKKAKEASYSESEESKKKQSGLTKAGKWGMGLGAAGMTGALGYSTAKGAQFGKEIGNELIEKGVNSHDDVARFMESKMKDAMNPGGKLAKVAKRANIGLAVGAGLTAAGALAYGAGKIKDRRNRNK